MNDSHIRLVYDLIIYVIARAICFTMLIITRGTKLNCFSGQTVHFSNYFFFALLLICVI